MKTAPLLPFLLLLMVTVACQNDDDSAPTSVPVPSWLQYQIEVEKALIATDSTQLPNYGAWIQYRFKDDLYYEYDNPLSSLSRNPYSIEGERMNLADVTFTNYWNERCCERYVWQGSRYTKLN